MVDLCGDGMQQQQGMWPMRRDYGQLDAQLLHDALTEELSVSPEKTTNEDIALAQNLLYSVYTAGFNAFRGNLENPYSPEETLHAEFERARMDAANDYNIEQEGFTSGQDDINRYDPVESKRAYHLWQLGQERKSRKS